jgi:hypothetical protein
MADGLQHPPHLPLAALVDGDLDPIRGQPLDPRRGGAAIVELDAVAQGLQRVLPHGRAPDLGVVGARDLEARMREPVRERAVVGEQDQPGGIGVEPPDRIEAAGAGDERDDRGPSLGVLDGGDDAARLVHGVDGALAAGHADGFAVDRHLHAAVDVARGVADHLVADAHAAGEHELLGGAARGHAGVGEVLGEAHGAVTIRAWT